MKESLERSRLVNSISEISQGFVTNVFDLSGTTFTLRGVSEKDTLSRFLDLLKDKIIIDLSPKLNECYALGPYSLFEEEQRTTALWGNLVNRAKYRKDPSARGQILDGIEDFINRHLIIRTVDAVVSAPKSDLSTPDLAGVWANEVADKRGWSRLVAHKTHLGAGPQKVFAETESEEDLISRVANTFGVSGVKPGSRVLILDDTIRSGGTLIEIARVLREGGAKEVYGISAAKDAKFTQGGVDLNKESWE